ncbi:hypothetical protein QR680_006354 [Steinernema hermaphroditum]|uniref:TIL domain-containing protein n=1 Tax=Steinernema hermaphroditum TaxID=289476 RepID=A0AA39HXM2_9BILA|nr:hypothetical protein QR680_006354 [Steinernema hermaphroditum]
MEPVLRAYFNIIPPKWTTEHCTLFSMIALVHLLPFFLSLLAVESMTTPKCPENEFWNPNATCDDTCEFPNAHNCPLEPWPRCTCIDGYVQVIAGGKCIPLKDCPPPPPECSCVKCPPGQHCVVHRIYCIRAPCPQPKPVCEEIPVGK